jgi:hypothetical protein
MIILLRFSFLQANAEIRGVLNRTRKLTFKFFQTGVGKEILTFTRHKVISEGLEGSIAPLIPNVGIDGGECSASSRCSFYLQGKSLLLRIGVFVGFRAGLEVSEYRKVFLPLQRTE